MTPPPTIIGRVLDHRWFRRSRTRRLTFGLAALLLAFLCVWPRHYVAKADLMPQDSGGGLSSLLNQSAGLVSLGAILGSHQSIEVDLAIGRGQAVIRDVVNRLHLLSDGKFRSSKQAEIALRRTLDISAIRGSILQVRAIDTDSAYAKRVVTACTAAIQDRLTAISLSQAAQKRTVATDRMTEATRRLANAQTEITAYRTAHRLAAPEIQLGAGVSQLATLQASLQAKEVQLETAGRFATVNNLQMQALQSDIVGLRKQIADAETASDGPGGPKLATIAQGSSEYFNLYRNEKFAELLYDVYSRYLEEVTIDELSASTNVVVIEPPYLDPSPQLNISAVALLIVVVSLAVLAEVYVITPRLGQREARE